MAKKSKKPKPKTGKKPIKKGKTSKPKPRQNPNQIKRIPAKAGAKAGSTKQVQVVLPTGARGGKDSYKTRSKEEIQEEKLQKARETLGITDATQLALQQQASRPVIQRQTGYIKPKNMEKYGGYTNLEEGYGVSSDVDKKLDARFERMEKKLLNAVKNETTGKSSVNEDASKSRISGMIEEVSSRSLTDNEKEIQKRKDLLQRRTRYNPRRSGLPPRNVRTPIAVSRDFTFYGSSLPTDAEVKKEKDEKEEKRKILIEEGKKQETESIVGSLLDNVFDNAVQQSDIKTQKKVDAKERSRILNERSIQRNNRRLENIRNKEERDRAIEQQKILKQQQAKEKDEKEREERIQKLREKDVEARGVSRDVLEDVIDTSINISDERTRIKSDAKEDDVRPAVKFNQTLKPTDIIQDFEARNRERSAFGDDARIQQKVGEIQETQGEIEDTGRRLIEVLDEEDTQENFEDVVDFEVPTAAALPLTDFTPSGALELEDEPQPPKPSELKIPSFVRGNNPVPRTQGGSRPLTERAERIRQERQKPLSQRRTDAQKKLREEAEKLRELAKKQEEKRETEKLSKDIVGDIADDAFSQSIKNAEKREKEIKENERKQREIQRKQTQEAKRQRELAKKVAPQFTQNLLQSSIEGAARKETAKDVASGIIAGSLLKTQQREAGVELAKSGSKSKTDDVEAFINSWERKAPERTDKQKRKKDKDRKTIRDDIELKNELEKEKSDILKELLELGLDGKVLSFNANRFTPVRSQNEDQKLKQIVKDLMMERQKQYPKELQNRIMVKIQSLLKSKYNLRQQQNKLRKYNV